MLDGFYSTLKAFEDANLNDPLNETLRLLDIFSNGALRNVDRASLIESGVDLQDFIAKRKQGIPLEYALGRTTFMGLQFYCSPAALIPRQETELLAKTAIEIINRPNKPQEPVLVIDMGTGSGNLAVSIAALTENTDVLACDVTPEAVELARSNVSLYNLQSRITLFCGDLFSPLAEGNYSGRVDMVVCNPPYIPTASLAKMASEIIDYEPVTAFDAGSYGIDIFRRLISESPDFLKSDGVLIFEIGEGQDKFVTRLLQKSGKFSQITHHSNEAGQTRVISAINSFLS